MTHPMKTFLVKGEGVYNISYGFRRFGGNTEYCCVVCDVFDNGNSGVDYASKASILYKS